MLAMGAGPVFYLGKVFRNGELSPWHNPEFTMLEWYRPDAELPEIQKDITDLIVFLAGQCLDSPGIQVKGQSIPLSPPYQQKSIHQCFLEKTGIDLRADRSLARLRAGAGILGIPYADDDDWQSLFFRIFLEYIEPWLGVEAPLFVSEYPAEMALMARLKKDDPLWAERCELYIGGVELANGYTECTDSREMRSRFEREKRLREKAGLGPARVDDELLSAFDTLPPSAGMSLGIDRLIMLFTGKTHIREVMLFPMHDYLDMTES
jgi:lysyl-tRNA synthetase class 2